MYTGEVSIQCSSCRKRDAVFKRRTSGEKLCRLCLYSSIVKQIRKALHYYKMIKKNSNAAFLIMANKPLLSLAALSVYESAVRDFNIDITVLCFDKYTDCGKISSSIKASNHKLIEVKDRFIARNFIEWLKYGEYMAVKIARESNIEFIAVPLCRDELSILSLFGLLTASRTIFSEGLPIREVNDIKITRPFYYVVSNDMTYLASTSKSIMEIDLNEHKFEEETNFFKHAKAILQNSPELMYSSSKSAELLQSYIFGRSKKCRYCGSYDVSDICIYCERIRKHVDDEEIS
ncbi:MAG: hypothetical protein QXG40_04765 [Ignisphaera sp.]